LAVTQLYQDIEAQECVRLPKTNGEQLGGGKADASGGEVKKGVGGVACLLQVRPKHITTSTLPSVSSLSITGLRLNSRDKIEKLVTCFIC
jgi:hypothetical protein